MDLTSKRILVTRPAEQAGEYAAALREAGAEPILFPAIEISSLEDPSSLDRALRRLTCYDWLILTSVNGVQAVWDRMDRLEIPRLPGSLRVAAIGPVTAGALRQRSVVPDFIPQEYVADAILPGLGEVNDKWVLLPRADVARRELPRAIQEAGGLVHEIVAYRTMPASPDPVGLRAVQEGVDVVTFTSSSTVSNFAALVRSAGLDACRLPGRPLIACIGPVTAATAQEHGLTVGVVADSYTTQGLLEALLEFTPTAQRPQQ